MPVRHDSEAMDSADDFVPPGRRNRLDTDAARRNRLDTDAAFDGVALGLERPCGLENPGTNQCWLNALIQVRFFFVLAACLSPVTLGLSLCDQNDSDPNFLI